MSANGLWFRCYADIYRNKKLRRLRPELQLFFLWLLALRKEEQLDWQDPDGISFQLRITLAKLAAWRIELFDADLIDESGQPVGWQERQFESDVSTPRVKRFRERSMKQDETVTETPSETETEQSIEGSVPYGDIVAYLNEKAGTAYRPKTGATRKHIAARFKDGFTLEDFRTVIDAKVAEWLHGTIDGKPAAPYLCPDTLFGTKFEKYLNNAKAAPPKPHVEKVRNLDDDIWREQNLDKDGNRLTPEQKAEIAAERERDREEIRNGWLDKELKKRAMREAETGV